MIEIISDNIISPLGNTSNKNYEALRQGKSCLKRYEDFMDIPDPFVASLMENYRCRDGYTKFESMIIDSISQALENVPSLDPSSDDVLFIISSTKGNIDLLDSRSRMSLSQDRMCIGVSAEKIASFFSNRNRPVVVSNACISGLCAEIYAARILRKSQYKYVIVSGCDVQSRFIISGFQSFHALSSSECRPFDIDRSGLNLGEAAATIIFKRTDDEESETLKPRWIVSNGSIRNDAYHISSPSKTGEGCMRVLQDVIKDVDIDDIGLISTHGTSTLYNDEMESYAIERAGLSSIPANSLKGYFGHTMGAAGILETIISMKEIESGRILGTRGFQEYGVSHRINVSGEERPTDKKKFIKLLSGFGGCNAAMLFEYSDRSTENKTEEKDFSYSQLHHVFILPYDVIVDGQRMNVEREGLNMLSELYHRCECNYPKFFKMDALSRLGFVASELLLNQLADRNSYSEKRNIIFFGKTGSLWNDMRYQQTIDDMNDYYPSPAVFVYTLPNIITGEVAIRNKYFGETSFFLLEDRDDDIIRLVAEQSMESSGATSAIVGWLDYVDDNNFVADIKLVSTNL